MNLSQYNKVLIIYQRIHFYVKLSYTTLLLYDQKVLFWDNHHYLHYRFRVNFIKIEWLKNQPQITADFNETMRILKPLEDEIRNIKIHLTNGRVVMKKFKKQ